jgi:ATP-binding cassette subfamily B protein
MGWMGPLIERDKEPPYMKDAAKLRRLLRDAMKYKRAIVLVAVTIFVSTAVSMVGPYVLELATNQLEYAKSLHGAIVFASVYASLYVINYFSQSRRTYLMMVVAQSVIKDLRDKGFESLQKVPINYFSKREAGRIMSYVTNDAEALADFLTFQLPQVLAGFMAIVGSIAIMLYLDASLTLVALVVIPLLGGFAYVLQKKIRENFLETRRKIAVVTARLQETISGVRVIQAFAREDASADKFDQANTENMRVNLKATKLTSFFNSAVQIIEALGIALVLYVGAEQVLGSQITVGLLIAFVFYVQGFFNPVLQLSLFYNSYQSAMTGLDRVYRLVDAEPQVKPGAKLMPLRDIMGRIEFKNVFFSYDNREVLHDVSFTIPPGSKVALVGPTGAGKTTISNILLKFYEPTSGRVLIDGYDMSKIDPFSYRRRVGVVLQEAFLFTGSVLENIRFGNPTLSDEEIKETLRRLGLEKLFDELTNKYDTVVTERGSNLSEGQKQIIGFARAIVRNPAILVLDEATSQLDPLTEAKLQEAMRIILRGRTAVIIAHRLSTVSLCDFVLYIEDGRIVEQGTPQELLRRGEKFAKLYNLQRGVS